MSLYHNKTENASRSAKFFCALFREGEEGGKINMDICMPSALTGFCFLMLERRIVRRAGEQDRKDGARRRKEIMMNV